MKFLKSQDCVNTPAEVPKHPKCQNSIRHHVECRHLELLECTKSHVGVLKHHSSPPHQGWETAHCTCLEKSSWVGKSHIELHPKSHGAVQDFKRYDLTIFGLGLPSIVTLCKYCWRKLEGFLLHHDNDRIVFPRKVLATGDT